MHKIIIITGPSGVGKTVLSEHVAAHVAVNRCITCTSRLPRPGEKDGVDYFFLSPDGFSETLENGGFVEHSAHYQASYGIRKVDLDAVLKKGPVLLVLNWQGAQSVAEAYDAEVLFIMPPSIEALQTRLEKRSGNSKRFQYAQEDMQHAGAFEHQLINDDLAQAKKDILDWVKKVL